MKARMYHILLFLTFKNKHSPFLLLLQQFYSIENWANVLVKLITD